MNFSQIKRLVKLVEFSSISELELNEEGTQIRISKGGFAPYAQPVMLSQSLPPSAASPSVEQQTAFQEAGAAPAGGDAAEGLLEICSPMIGTFYRAPSPDAPPYVNEGESILPGKVLCIVEAMKLMNEIEAEISGKIVKILVENAQPVEYNQPLFLVEKA